MCREAAPGHPIVFRQSNREYEIIEWVHEAIDEGSGIIINPAAFTFTSMAIMDALKMFPGPIIELHISNIHRREPIYHKSYVSPVATAVIAGLGTNGYPVAVQAMLDMIAKASGKRLKSMTSGDHPQPTPMTTMPSGCRACLPFSWGWSAPGSRRPARPAFTSGRAPSRACAISTS